MLETESATSVILDARRRKSVPRPVSEADVIGLIRSRVSTLQISKAIRERGTDFTLTPDVKKRLQDVGAAASLLETIEAGGAKKANR